MHQTKMIRALRAAVNAKRYANEFDDPTRRDCDEALDWLAGKNVRSDWKIETRHHVSGWRHVLMQGSLGYSAANPFVSVLA